MHESGHGISIHQHQSTKLKQSYTKSTIHYKTRNYSRSTCSHASNPSSQSTLIMLSFCQTSSFVFQHLSICSIHFPSIFPDITSIFQPETAHGLGSCLGPASTDLPGPVVRDPPRAAPLRGGGAAALWTQRGTHRGRGWTRSLSSHFGEI